MRNTIFILGLMLYVTTFFGQIEEEGKVLPNHKTSDYALTDDIVKLEEAVYIYDAEKDEYIKKYHYDLTFKNGKLIEWLETYESAVYYTYTFKYNDNGNLIQLLKGGDLPKESIDFIYKNDRLNKKEERVNYSLRTTSYEYDTDGNISKETQFEDEILEAVTDYEYQDDDAYTAIKTWFNNDGETSSIYQYKFKKGNKVLYQELSGNDKPLFTYEYDEKGNLNKEFNGERILHYYQYEYDKKGNWDQCYSFRKALDISYFYTFRKVTFKDGSTFGSTDIDMDFVNKWENYKRDVSSRECIIGDCKNGYAKFFYKDGTVYKGFIKKGKRNGVGTMIYVKEKENYMGTWKKDKKDGFGVFNGKEDSYYGFWKKNIMDGKAFYIGSNNEVYAVIMDKGKEIKKFQNIVIGEESNKEQGACIAGDCQNGFGKLVMDNDDECYGFFTKGIQDILGFYSSKSGDFWIGEVSKGKKNGFGVSIETKGVIYYGMYKNNLKHGLGFYYDGQDPKNDKTGVFKKGILSKDMSVK